MIDKEKRVLSSILDNFILSAEQEKKAKEILASALRVPGITVKALREYTPEINKNKSIVESFVNQQYAFSINPNGKIERNVLVNEFNKYCYDNGLKHDLKRDEIIEMVKDNYYKRSGSKLSKQEFFDSLKPQQFKYRW